MKLRIHGQAIRIRIDEDELARLLAGRSLEDATALPDGMRWARTLTLADAAPASFHCAPGHWSVVLPRDAVEAHGNRLPCREGLAFSWTVAGPAGLSTLILMLEVDVRDSTRKRTTDSRTRQAVATGKPPAG